MRKLVTVCAVLGMVLAVSGAAQATMITYSIVDYPAYQLDIVTGLTDHVSGTITADPTTGVINSASFTITGLTSYTVALATIDPYYVHISPTEITVTASNPSNNLGYGDLRLSGLTDGGAYPTASLEWYTPGQPWIEGSNNWAGYSGAVLLAKGKNYGADFAGSGATPFTQGGVNGSYYGSFVVATAVPEPATICLLGLGGLALLRKRKF